MTDSLGVRPTRNYVVVRLGQLMQLNKVHVPTGKYDTHTDGVVVEVPVGYADMQLVGKKVYFSEFKEGTKFSRDGIEYAFVKLDDIEGYED